MREKRYSKDMKGTQEEEEESYPYFDIYPINKEEAETQASGFERLRTNRMWGRNGKNI